MRSAAMVCLLALLSPLASQGQSSLALPVPTGAFSVGLKILEWEDRSRGNRWVQVVLWYPAASRDLQTPAQYYPNIKALQADQSTQAELQEIFGSSLVMVSNGQIISHASEDTLPLRQRFPVILFSPGLGLSPFIYTAQLENLASHGYMVAAISHPGDTTSFINANGVMSRFEEVFWSQHPAESADANVYEQRAIVDARDMLFVLKRLQADTLSRSIDFHRLGAFGHSQGGRIAAAACQLSPEFKACLNEDGRFDEDSLQRPFWPMNQRLFSGSFAMLDWFDPGIEEQDYVSMHTTALNFARDHLRPGPAALRTYESVHGRSYRLTVLRRGMSHTSFSDLRFLNAPSDEARDRAAENLSAINLAVLAFFDEQLIGKTSPLLHCGGSTPNLLVQCFLQKRKPRTASVAKEKSQ